MARKVHSSLTLPRLQKIRSSNQSRNLATRQPNNLQKEIRWLIEEKYGGKITQEAEKDIARLRKGEHIDYVIGWVDFAGCRIDLSPSLAGPKPRLAWSKRSLIPRPETEFWVQQVIRELRGQNFEIDFKISPSSLPSLRILDIFAGSGCIGIAVLKHIHGAFVDFAEKDKKLLKQIAINAKLNRIDSRHYRVFQSDVFSNVKGKYDYILANPPYVAETRKAKVQKSVLEQEPRNAIFGGKDGLYYIRKFLKRVGDYLVPGGVVYLEFDSYQKPILKKIIQEAGASDLAFCKDQFCKWRYARIVF